MFLLIIGAPRSGTTLFASMIGMHSDVAMLIEDKFFSIKRLTGKKVLANKLCIPNQMELTKKANYTTRTLRKFGMYMKHPTSRYNAEDYLMLEDLKILSITRDANDVISSIMKRGKKEKDIAMGRWCRAIEIIHELNTKYPEKTATIAYEDLVTEPEKILKKVASFIGVEFQPQMLEGYKHNILYPGEKSIDNSRAFKSKTSLENDNIYQLAPDIIDLYHKLLHGKISPGE